jgi:hypothetical protein
MLRRYEVVEVREPIESLLYMKSWRMVRIGKRKANSEGLTLNRPGRSLHSASPYIYASANPRSLIMQRRIQNVGLRTLNSAVNPGTGFCLSAGDPGGGKM